MYEGFICRVVESSLTLDWAFDWPKIILKTREIVRPHDFIGIDGWPNPHTSWTVNWKLGVQGTIESNEKHSNYCKDNLGKTVRTPLPLISKPPSSIPVHICNDYQIINRIELKIEYIFDRKRVNIYNDLLNEGNYY